MELMTPTELMTHKELDEAIDKYFANASPELLTLILKCAGPLPASERALIVKRLAGLESTHGMTKSELKKEMKRLMESADGKGFFENGTLRPIRVVEDMRNRSEYLTTAEDDTLRVYKGGVFCPDLTRETSRLIVSMLGDNATHHHVANVTSLLKDVTTCETPRHTDWVNLANGRWCLHSWELLPHAPACPSVLQLPVAYRPDLTCPHFDKWLSDVLPAEDDQMLLLQLIGYSMLQDVRFGKIAVLFGPTHTGKSTCLEVLQAFLGAKNVSALSLHALDNEERRFTRSGMVGKLANVSADLSSKYLSGDSQIKQIASGDLMEVEYKGVQSFSYSPFCTLWASSNELPLSHDRTDAWYERLVILPFINQHTGEKADRQLIGKLTAPAELSGILNRVLGALQLLLQDNVFLETESTRQMLAQYRLDNDHVSRYLTESCERSGEVGEVELYTHYEDWCESEGVKPLPKTKFRDGVTKWGGQRKRLGSDGARRFVFVGVSLV